MHVGINFTVARSRHESDCFCSVHGTAAAKRDDEVAIFFLVNFQARLNDFVGRLGVRAVEDDVGDINFFERVFDLGSIAELDHKLVGDDKSLGTFARNVFAQFGNDIDAGNNFRRYHKSIAHKYTLL